MVPLPNQDSFPSDNESFEHYLVFHSFATLRDPDNVKANLDDTDTDMLHPVEGLNVLLL